MSVGITLACRFAQDFGYVVAVIRQRSDEHKRVTPRCFDPVFHVPSVSFLLMFIEDSAEVVNGNGCLPIINSPCFDLQINMTENGANANFTRSFPPRYSYYLCYSKATSGGMVVSDIQLITDKDAIRHGYCLIAEHLEPKATVWKKKHICVRVVPVGSVDTAVLDIKLTTKSKMMLQHYTYVGDIHGYVLWCRKGHFTSSTPQAKPRSVSLDLRRLSLELPSTPQPLKPSNPPQVPQGKLSHRRHSLHGTASKPVDSSIQGITALDGVPFSLHPKFNIKPNATNPQLNYQLNNIRIKSLQDIENEYNYTFSVEEFAAKRTRPLVSTSSSAQ